MSLLGGSVSAHPTEDVACEIENRKPRSREKPFDLDDFLDTIKQLLEELQSSCLIGLKALCSGVLI